MCPGMSDGKKSEMMAARYKIHTVLIAAHIIKENSLYDYQKQCLYSPQVSAQVLTGKITFSNKLLQVPHLLTH